MNVWSVVVRRSVFLGDMTQVHVDWGGRELIIRRTMLNALAEGDAVYLSVALESCILLEPE